jgi:hypothetical protein
MAILNINSSTLGSPLQDIFDATEIVPGSAPSYALCKTIYSFHVLGKKMVDAPIAMAMSQAREISIPDGPEDRVKQAFLDEWSALSTDKHIANTFRLARIYGCSAQGLLIDGVDTNTPADCTKLWKLKISFSEFDPLNTSGSLVLNQNPNAMDYQKVTGFTVQGKRYHMSRGVVVMNEDPIFIEFTTSAFGYVGRSVYQRALFPLKSFLNTMITDDMVVTKVGVIIAKMKAAGSIVSNAMQKLFGLKREVVKEAQVGNVIGITTEEDIESLNLQNLDAPYTLARRNIIENIATAEDMPAKILLQETFAEGFGEGTEDAKYVAQYIDRFREEMRPLYVWWDQIVMYRAWNPDFYKTIQELFPKQYGKVSFEEAFTKWRNSFSWKWPSLLREPDSELIKVDDVKLRAVIALLEVLLPTLDPANQVLLIAWAADSFNELKLLFQSPVDLDFDQLLTFKEEKQERDIEAQESAAEGIPKPPKPSFGAKDSGSVTALAALDVAIGRLKRVAPQARRSRRERSVALS